jgi:hypothetical protein
MSFWNLLKGDLEYIYTWVSFMQLDKPQLASLLIVLFSIRHRHEKSITSIIYITIQAHLFLLVFILPAL